MWCGAATRAAAEQGSPIATGPFSPTAGTSCHHTSRLLKIQFQKRFGSSDAMSWLGEQSRMYSAMSFPVWTEK